MSQPFLGEIRVLSFNFPPRGWFACEGQLLPISQYTALFSLIGTFYGGNGTSTFALPDFRGRAPIHQGNNFFIGQSAGSETATILESNLPAHSHTLAASTAVATTQSPTGAYLAQPERSGPALYETTGAASTALAIGSLASAGGNQPISTHQPTVVLNFCIAYQGIFPSRN